MGPIKGPNIVTIPQKSLYIELRVIGEGYLKDGTIKLSKTNSVTNATLITDEVIKVSFDNNVATTIETHL